MVNFVETPRYEGPDDDREFLGYITSQYFNVYLYLNDERVHWNEAVVSNGIYEFIVI